MPIRDSRRGFTFIEVMFVILLLGVMAGLVAVKLDGVIPYYKFRATAREMANLIKLAKSTAIIRGVTLYVEYDLTNQQYWILSPDELPESEKEIPEGLLQSGEAKKQYSYVFYSQVPNEVVIQDIMAGNNEVFRSGIVTIECTPYGTVDQHVVHLMMKSSGEAQYYSIIVSPVTGFVRFTEDYATLSPVVEDETEY